VLAFRTVAKVSSKWDQPTNKFRPSSKCSLPFRNGPCVTKCKRKSWIFVWNRNSPGAELPNDVGFLVRRGEVILLDVHYQDALLQKGVKDYAGVRIHYTQERQVNIKST
jgi:hypothetical protein